jgi:hypothetical protein
MNTIPFSLLAAAMLTVGACSLFEGPEGPAGDVGAQGEQGSACWDLNGNGEADPDSEDLNGDGSVDVYDCQGLASDGSDGEDGEDWSPPSMVGAAACADCHPDDYEAWLRSGHANAQLATGGAEPTEPWASLGEFGEYSAAPPAGYTWSEISYVIGGWSRKQVYVDAEGWVVTGADAAWAQQHDAWIAYEEGEAPGTLAFDCARCHTTGYRPEGNHDGLPGAVGTWQADGVQCERCHGNGSQHVDAPYDVDMPIDRSAELCGECHVRDSTDEIQAADGFLMDSQQWTELFHGKKHVMDCADCHDPHRSSHFDDDVHNPERGSQVPCESCHFQQAANQGSSVMKGYAGCTGCHMPDIVVSAQASHSWGGDHPAHLFAINTDIDADQVDGDSANPWVSLNFACRSCHSAGGGWTNYSDAELLDEAVGYHD